MGMSASQVRFLSLQHRKNDIGRELTTLSNRKMGLSRDMNRVSKNYTDAMNKTVLRWSNDCGKSYNIMNYDMLMKPNDLNCETPYIVTDSQGRVVVDDTKIFFDKENAKLLIGEKEIADAGFAGKGVSYRQLASAISSYSGVDSLNNNQLQFAYQNALGIDSHTIGNFTHANYATTAKFGSSSADGCQYEVVKGIKDYDYENTIRYDLMTQLGILTKAESDKFNAILDELYGTQNGIDFDGDYEGMLEKFDECHAYKVGGDGGDGYDKFFGKLIKGSYGTLELDGGCAKGNLALAKAYKREYNAYLNTNIQHMVNTDKTGDKADLLIEKSTAANIWEMDAGNTQVVSKYKYDKKSESGISNRIVGLMTYSNNADGKVTATSVSGGTQYKMDVLGVLNNLSFQKNETTKYTNFKDAFNRVGSGDYNVYANKRGEDSTWGYFVDGRADNNRNVDIAGMTTWGQLYNSLGTGEFDNSKKVSITGYTQGENRPNGKDLIQIWDSLEVSNNLELNGDPSYNTHDSGGDNPKTSTGGWFELLRDSVKSLPGANKDAADYAYEKMCYLYHDGINDNTENSDGSTSGYKTRRRAARECYDNFGVGWCNEFGTSDDGIAINATNAIAAFVTFYEMYMRTLEDSNLEINDGTMKTKVFKTIVGQTENMFDTTLAKKVLNSEQIINAEFTSWQTSCTNMETSAPEGENITNFTATTNPPTLPAADTTNPKTITFTYEYDKETTELDEDGNPQTKNSHIKEVATVTGIWNGTNFTNITSLTTQSYTGGKLEGQSKMSLSGNTYTVERYKGNFDSAGNSLGTVSKTGTITYKKNGTIVEGSVTLPSGGEISTMAIDYSNEGGAKIKSINSLTGEDMDNQFKVDGNLYMLIEKNGSDVIVAEDYENLYKISPDKMTNCQITQTFTMKPVDDFGSQLDDMVTYWQDKVNKLEEDLNKAFGGLENKFMDYFDVLFKRISENGWVYDEKVNNTDNPKASTTYLNTMLQNNKYYLTEARELSGDAKYNYTMKIAEDVVKVYEVHDTNAENQALAEYESAKTLIAMKEKKIDTRMTKLETEQQVINTELDSIEKVKNDNIEKYFKIFA